MSGSYAFLVTKQGVSESPTTPVVALTLSNDGFLPDFLLNLVQQYTNGIRLAEYHAEIVFLRWVSEIRYREQSKAGHGTLVVRA